MLTLLRDRHNTRASLKHRRNFPNYGHYEHYYFDFIKDLTRLIYGRDTFRWHIETTGNPNPDESFGIVPCISTKHPHYISTVSAEDISDYTSSMKYLAKRMRTIIPHLPVTTKEERQLYSLSVSFYLPEGKGDVYAIDFHAMAADWNAGTLKFKYKPPKFPSSPNGRTILRKQPEHLKSYFSTYFKGVLRKNINTANAVRLGNLKEAMRLECDVTFQEPAFSESLGYGPNVESALFQEIEQDVLLHQLQLVGVSVNEPSLLTTSFKPPVPAGVVALPLETSSQLVEQAPVSQSGDASLLVRPRMHASQLQQVVQPLHASQILDPIASFSSSPSTSYPVRILPATAGGNNPQLMNVVSDLRPSVDMFQRGFVSLTPGNAHRLQPQPPVLQLHAAAARTRQPRRCATCGRPSKNAPETCKGGTGRGSCTWL